MVAYKSKGMMSPHSRDDATIVAENTNDTVICTINEYTEDKMTVCGGVRRIGHSVHVAIPVPPCGVWVTKPPLQMGSYTPRW